MSSRPTRMAAKKVDFKKYAEDEASSDSDSDVISIHDSNEDDSDFDDPDKIEVPGGGTTLEKSKLLAPSPPSEPKATASTSNQSTSMFTATGRPSILRKGGQNSAQTFLNQNARPGSAAVNPARFDPTTIDFKPSVIVNQNNSSVIDPIGQLLGMFANKNSSEQFPYPFFQPLPSAAGMFGQISQLGQLLGGNGPNQLDMKALMGMGMSMGMGAQLGRPPTGYPMVSSGAYPMPTQPQLTDAPKQAEFEEEAQDEEEGLGIAETYAEYVPAKLKIGKPHPDPIIETASLASVAPPDVYYKLRLPYEIMDDSLLSNVQLEAVIYACQQHENNLPSGDRAGYLIGDGAGVGKGRTIAGIIYENWLCGRKKSLWVSVSPDLKEDSIRDLRDIGATKLRVHALNKLKYGKIRNEDLNSGVLFSTYSGLIGESSTGGKFNSRYKQIVDWLGKDFDGVIVFDECHRAKNLCPVGCAKPTKTGITVSKLQEDLKHARVVYASATGASEPKNMAYMSRLGIWGLGTPFPKFTDFINAIEKRGVGAMEVVAMDMKLRGAYIARQLSFQGVTFKIEEVPLGESFQNMYNESVDLWVNVMNRFHETSALMKLDADKATRKSIWSNFWAAHQRFFKYLCIAGKVNRAVEIAREAVKDGKCVVIGLQSTGEARTAEQMDKCDGDIEEFVSTAKGVLQSLVEKHLPAPNRNKTNRILGLSLLSKLAEEQPQPGSSNSKGKPVRKAAQNASKFTKRPKLYESDASTEDDKDSDFSAAPTESESEVEEVSTDSKASESEFDSVSSEMESEEEGKGRKRKATKKKAPKAPVAIADAPSPAAMDQAWKIRLDLLEKIEQLGNRMPSNTLDQLIDDLGGPEDVAEMTGRKMRLIQMESGKIEYQSRAESDVSLDQINLREKKRFMEGEKNIAIISEAASSGISLQSDRRVKNKRRRVHITLELPWSADRAIQQFGRTHRSNQMNAPEYVFLISDLAGEHRFASIVAKRLESLGALTHGDRRATESRDLSRFHIDNKYGKTALECVMKHILTGTTYGIPVPPPPGYNGPGDFRADVAAGLVGVGLIVSAEDNNGGTQPDKDYTNMSKFLNRILGMHVNLQNHLFKFFSETLSAIVLNAKRQGRYDMGILHLGDSNADKTDLVGTSEFTRKHATGEGRIELHTVEVERGMSWEEARKKYDELHGTSDGFYVSNEEKRNKRTAILISADDYNTSGEKTRMYSIHRPSTGLQLRRETLKEIQGKYHKVTPDKAIKAWETQFNDSGEHCIHAFWSGKCKNVIAGFECEVGKRKRTYFVLSGSVLLCWDHVEKIMNNKSHNHKIQIVRVQCKNGSKFVGILIPPDLKDRMEALLQHTMEIEKEEAAEEENEEALGFKMEGME